MKRPDHTLLLLLMLFVASAFFVSGCRQHDDDDITPVPQERPMAFVADVQQSGQTRALTTEVTDMLQDGYPGIGVFAYHTSLNNLFLNTRLTGAGTDETDQVWAYAPLRYWNTTANLKYFFSAYAPYCPAHDDGDYVAGKPYIEYGSLFGIDKDDNDKVKATFQICDIPQWQNAADGFDLLIAKEDGIQDKAASEFPDGKVPLVFHHALALLHITASTESMSPVKVTDITLGNATYTVPGDGEMASFNYTGTDDGTTVWGEFTPSLARVEGQNIMHNDDGVEVNLTSTVQLAKVLIVPFRFEGTDEETGWPITLNYTINTSNYEKTAMVTGFTSFDKDTEYTIKLNITDNGVKIDRVQVGFRKWEGDDTNHGNTDFFNW